jgi:hypothetical protein
MKKMLIAAAAVGAGIAGIILYAGRNGSARHKVKDASKNTYNMNEGTGEKERLEQHAMG